MWHIGAEWCHPTAARPGFWHVEHDKSIQSNYQNTQISNSPNLQLSNYPIIQQSNYTIIQLSNYQSIQLSHYPFLKLSNDPIIQAPDKPIIQTKKSCSRNASTWYVTSILPLRRRLSISPIIMRCQSIIAASLRKPQTCSWAWHETEIKMLGPKQMNRITHHFAGPFD